MGPVNRKRIPIYFSLTPNFIFLFAFQDLLESKHLLSLGDNTSNSTQGKDLVHEYQLSNYLKTQCVPPMFVVQLCAITSMRRLQQSAAIWSHGTCSFLSLLTGLPPVPGNTRLVCSSCRLQNSYIIYQQCLKKSKRSRTNQQYLFQVLSKSILKEKKNSIFTLLPLKTERIFKNLIHIK